MATVSNTVSRAKEDLKKPDCIFSLSGIDCQVNHVNPTADLVYSAVLTFRIGESGKGVTVVIPLGDLCLYDLHVNELIYKSVRVLEKQYPDVHCVIYGVTDATVAGISMRLVRVLGRLLDSSTVLRSE